MFCFLVNYIAIKIELRKSRVKMISMFPGPSVTNINCFYLALKTCFFLVVGGSIACVKLKE